LPDKTHELPYLERMSAPRIPIVATFGRWGATAGILEGFSQFARTRPDWDVLVIEGLVRDMIYYMRDLKPRAVVAFTSDSSELALIKSASDTVINTIEFVQPETLTVCVDNRQIGRLVGERLLALGATSLVYVGVHMTGDDPIRFQGFRDAAEKAGVPCSLVRAESVFDHNRRELVRSDLAGHFRRIRNGSGHVGVMAFSDWVGFQVVRALQDGDLKVPGEFLVIGVDNDAVFANLCRPRLTSMDPGYQGIGREAGAVLDRILNGKSPKEQIIRVAPAGIVERESAEAVGPEDSELFRALMYLRDHALVPTTPEQVADHVGRSRRWLDMRLLDKLGRTAANEIERLRMEHATRLLRDPHMALSEISHACGYKTLSNFCRAFRAARGLTPTQWRRGNGV
jgi:LacI family transcriptional regulator